MKCSVLQEQFAKAIAMASRAVDPRNSIPALTHLLIEADEARGRVVATTLQTTIEAYFGAKVDKAGGIALPAKTLKEFVSALPEGRIDLTTNEAAQSATLKCGTTKSTIKGLAASEFPTINHAQGNSVAIPGKALKRSLRRVSQAIAKEDYRPVLTGVLFEINNNMLTLAAADGFRLAVDNIEIDRGGTNGAQYVVPRRSIEALAALIDEEQDVLVAFDDIHATFEVSNTLRVHSQLLDGKFPDFRAVIPKQWDTEVIVYAEDMLRALVQAEVFARDSGNSVQIKAKPSDKPGELGTVTITGKSNERGDNEGLIDAVVKGEPLEANYNALYLIEFMRGAGEQVVLRTKDATSAAVFREAGDDNFLLVVMPMSTQR